MKKKTIIIIISTIIIAIIGIILFNIFKKADYTLKEYPISKLPKFSINITGNEMDIINLTQEELKKKSIKAYRFSKDIDNNWETVTNDYIGVRLLDILTTYELDYSDIEIYETDKYSTKFSKDEINDDVYIVFLRDGKRLGDIESTALISFKDSWDKSLTDFNYIFLYRDTPLYDPSKYESLVDDSDVYAP